MNRMFERGGERWSVCLVTFTWLFMMMNIIGGYSSILLSVLCTSLFSNNYSFCRSLDAKKISLITLKRRLKKELRIHDWLFCFSLITLHMVLAFDTNHFIPAVFFHLIKLDRWSVFQLRTSFNESTNFAKLRSFN